MDERQPWDEKSRVLMMDGYVVIQRGSRKYKFVYKPDVPDEGDHFGNCPRCWETDGLLKTDGHLPDDGGRGNWFVCRKHKIKWCVGTGLISTDLSSEEYLRCEYLLASYQTVEPIHDFRCTAEYSDKVRMLEIPLADQDREPGENP
jgi:hypothetical protein